MFCLGILGEEEWKLDKYKLLNVEDRERTFQNMVFAETNSQSIIADAWATLDRVHYTEKSQLVGINTHYKYLSYWLR